MYRYWFFVLLLAMLGSIAPLASLIEGATPVLFGFYGTSFFSQILVPGTWSGLADYCGMVAPVGTAIGAFIGLVVALCDRWRNSATDRSGARACRRLAGNLLWCGLYALVVILLNGTLSALYLYWNGSPLFRTSNVQYVLFIPMLATGIANAASLIWALVRTVTASDVLTPRVLLAKLRRSARLQEA